MKKELATIKVYAKDRRHINVLCAKHDGLTQAELVSKALLKYSLEELMKDIKDIQAKLKSKKKS